MAEEFTYTNYSVEDIESYLHGRMNAKEMHQLERAALQDAFLADAIEGYRHAPFTQTYKHLDDIAAGILGEKQPAKIVAMPVKANYWRRVAGAVGFIVIAGSVWYAVNNSSAYKHNNMAPVAVKQKDSASLAQSQPALNSPSSQYGSDTNNQESSKKVKIINGNKLDVAIKKAPAPPETASTQALGIIRQEDSKDSDKDESVQLTFVDAEPVPAKLQKAASGIKISTATEKADSTVLAEDDVSVGKKTISNTNNFRRLYNVNAAPVQAFGPSFNQLNEITNNSRDFKHFHMDNKVEGIVVDNNKKPLGNALVYTGKGKQMAVTDSMGYFRLNAADSQLAAEVSSAGYETKQVQLKSNTINYILVNQAPSMLSKVEVVDLESEKRAIRKLPADSLFPEGGWQSFRDYVYKKLHNQGKNEEIDTSGMDLKSFSGASIEIEFTVDDEGFVRNLKVTKSVNEKIDAKAVEVMQHGPKWIATRKNKKGKVVIQF